MDYEIKTTHTPVGYKGEWIQAARQDAQRGANLERQRCGVPRLAQASPRFGPGPFQGPRLGSGAVQGPGPQARSKAHPKPGQSLAQARPGLPRFWDPKQLKMEIIKIQNLQVFPEGKTGI